MGFIQSTVELAEQRFGKRLGDEIKGLRDDMAKLETGLKGEMTKLETGLRDDMAKLETGLKGEMALVEGRLKKEWGEMKKDLNQSLLWHRQDINVAFKEINIRRKVDIAITKRVKALEKAQ